MLIKQDETKQLNLPRNLTKCWFYILGFESPNKKAQVNFSPKCLPNTGMKILNGHYMGEQCFLLYIFTDSSRKALVTMMEAKRCLEKINETKFLVLPVPDDWHFGSNTRFQLRVPKNTETTPKDVTSRFSYEKFKREREKININTAVLKQVVNKKIGQNDKWTNALKKFLNKIKVYENQLENDDALFEIITYCDCFSINIEDLRGN